MKAITKSTTAGAEGTDGGRNNSRRRNKINPWSPPTSLTLHGVQVHFPFRPYPCQETYMQTVMDALLKSENALLESPTGTGKTLCLLCSTLAWQRQERSLLALAQPNTATTATATANHNNNNNTAASRVPTILYASRTHSQLSQVVRELRNTRYRPKYALLGSREQMCVHPKVNTNGATASDINHACQKKCQDRKCQFRNRLDQMATATSGQGHIHNNNVNGSFHEHEETTIMDMEELVEWGKSATICPFYYSRNQVEGAELIFIPYNYLFDKDARSSTLQSVNWSNAVIIFDEAHNLESFASDSASFELTNIDIAGCIVEIDRAVRALSMQSGEKDLKESHLLKCKEIFLLLERYLQQLGPQTAYHGSFIFEFFRAANVTHGTHEILAQELVKINDWMADLRGTKRGMVRLEHFIQCLKRVFGHGAEARCLAKAACYRVHVSAKTTTATSSSSTTTTARTNNSSKANSDNTAARTISYWCFAPSLAMEDLADLNVRSILVTSGTLSPLPSYQMELGLPFPHTLENPHIIEDHQIYTRVVGRGPSGKVLSSSYERRQDREYFAELGNALIGVARVTPGGMLVFFPSYSVMESCLDEWGGPASHRKRSAPNGKKSSNDFFAARRGLSSSYNNKFSFARANATFQNTTSCIWLRLLALKAIVVEPKTSADLPEAMEEFKSFLDLPKSSGCLLLGVCRGKVSEGIDFANNMSRAVCITGLPFPPAFDPKVKMKREFLDVAKSSANSTASANGGFGTGSGGGGGSDGRGTTTRAVVPRLSGHEWYTQQAHRAVNQAVGRVIRNRSDYGAVILMDERFANPANQAGLSKWLRPHIQKDEGFGALIGSLASFFRTAEAESNKRADQERQRNAAAVLQYEEEEDNVQPTQVAVIQQPAPSGGTDEEKQSMFYISPESVVARMNSADYQRSAVDAATRSLDTPLNLSSDQPTKSNNKNHDAVFASRPASKDTEESAPSVSTKNKNTAQEFMDLVRQNMTKEEQSKIKKLVVAMKTAGDTKDVQGYQRYALATVRMVLSCERFEDNPGDESMLFKLFALLPKMYRKSILLQGFAVVVELSTLGQYYAQHTVKSKLAESLRTIAALLYSVWCRSSDVPLPNDAFFRDASPIIAKVASQASKSSIPALRSFLNLIPKHFHSITQAHYDDLVAARNMKQLRDADRKSNRDGDGNDLAIHAILPLPKRKLDDNPPNATQADGHAAKKKPSVGGVSVSNPYAKKSPLTTKSSIPSNPYARKQLHHQSVVANGFNGSGTNSYTTTRKLAPNLSTAMAVPSNTTATAFVASIQQQPAHASSSKHSASSLRLPAPSLPCPICNAEKCHEPFLAACGHVACWQCWQSWLRRSETCVTCRQPTALSSLARLAVAVDRDQARKNTPTTANREELVDDADADDTDDDELEITT